MLHKVRVLYAEDNRYDADLTKAHFSRSAPDFDIEIVGTASECLARLHDMQYDVLLLDHHLPDSDGIRVLKEVAARGLSLPIVVVTAVGDEALVVQVLRLGACDYVPKQGDYLENLPTILGNAVTEHAALKRRGHIPGRQRDILYLEHNAADVDLTLAHFAGAAVHLNVEIAQSCTQALALLQEKSFDLVLTDLRMPDMSALELLREAKYRGIEVPFIVITGKGDEAAAIASLKLGAYDYIVKRDNYIIQLPYAIDNAIARSQQVQINLRLQSELVERGRKEESLRRLAAVIESSDDAIISKLLDGTITSWNRGAEKLYGYTAGEAIGRNISMLMPPDRAGDSAWIMEQLRRSEYIEHYETVRVGKDGRQLYVSLTISPIKNPDGSVWGASTIARDVTERRRLEEQFLEAQKLESVARLAGGVAHDFNNLLTIINGNSELALSNLDESARAYEQIREIQKAGDRAASLTRQLLAFSRRQVLQPSVLDLNVIVSDVTRMLQRLIGEHIELIAVLEPSLNTVLADPGQIEQVIVNLAVNARDAMPEGGKLTISTANVDLDESYSAEHAGVTPGPHVMLAVSDTGIGMDQQTQAKIFEPFFTTKKKGEGTGLGLSTVYGIVKQSGGHIWMYSEPSRGTTFKVYLPRFEGSVDPHEERVIAEPTRGSETILLVEDEPGLRRLANTILTRVGYTVLEASDGREALRVSEGHGGEIHLMVTDVVMPEMSGRELANRLGAVRPKMKVLFMSGYTDDAIVHHGVLDPDTPFLQKPFTPAGLARKVRQTIDD